MAEVRAPHPLAGKTVTLKSPDSRLDGMRFEVEDWWQNVSGGSWMDAVGNPAALNYAGKVAMKGLPIDNEVVYGKVDCYGHLVHVSELGDETAESVAAHG